jgi:two-component system, NarL family, nitrate/nitrite response regulator NarL
MSANLLIVDDHRVFCQGLEAVFAAEPDFEPMAVSRPDQVLAAVTACAPDAVVMDVRIGRASGIDLTRRLTALPSPPAVVVLTAYADTATAFEAIRAGAVGFLPKSASVEQVICAVRAARLGGTWLNAEMLKRLLAEGPASARSRRQPIGQLTAREHQVLCLLVSGLDRNAIANQLHQSPNTVRTHIRNVTVKLGCHSAIEAVAAGLRAGLRPELPPTAAKPSPGSGSGPGR